ncbi:LytTR family DNA-binding domain-containing protein [Christensenella intestinihominis]|uniref:LytTR family DNA-binding domain-containing protein n=1 Tax=Christensenella intestinihominis TaxID=1851429 RepID=UPI000832734E|nr:LytTR family DNA-binding domain-containing protein [Christensenella intestinihominis]
MKLLIDQSPDNEEVEITIKCGLIDPGLEKLIEQIRLYSFSVTAKRDGKTFQIRLEDVYYFESVDNRTFVYTQQEVYECGMKLYELENQLAKTNFVRISKSCILSVTRLENVRALLNGKMEAELDNGEKVIVTRHYVDALKQKLGL